MWDKQVHFSMIFLNELINYFLISKTNTFGVENCNEKLKITSIKHLSKMKIICFSIDHSRVITKSKRLYTKSSFQDA